MHSKYQEWQGSRWDYTKSRSSWHFDPTVKNQEDFTQVCRFDGNWSDEIIKYSNLVEDAKWSTRNFEIDRIYSASEEEADLIRAGADPDMKIFQRTQIQAILYFDISHKSFIFRNMASLLFYIG